MAFSMKYKYIKHYWTLPPHPPHLTVKLKVMRQTHQGQVTHNIIPALSQKIVLGYYIMQPSHSKT